jgi:hypothetical protein
MDAFAGAISEAASWGKGDLTAAYFETEQGGVARIREPDAALAMVPLAFFLEHGDELKLTPRFTVLAKGSDGTEAWTLFAKKGRVGSAAALDGWQIVSVEGYSPRFVRRVALGGIGRIPDSAKIVASAQVLSALRKAASGENVTVLLNREATAAVATLPFAAELESVTQSPPMPQGFLCTVGKRLSAERWRDLAGGFQRLKDSPSGLSALDAVRLTGFGPVDEKALAAVKRAFDRPESAPK